MDMLAVVTSGWEYFFFLTFCIVDIFQGTHYLCNNWPGLRSERRSSPSPLKLTKAHCCSALRADASSRGSSVWVLFQNANAWAPPQT